jgi:hypothetical protein
MKNHIEKLDFSIGIRAATNIAAISCVQDLFGEGHNQGLLIPLAQVPEFIARLQQFATQFEADLQAQKGQK